MPISSITLPNSLKAVSFVVLLFYQLVLSSTLTLPNSTFGYIHTVFVWWAPFSHSYTFWTKRKHLTRNSFSDAFFRLAYSHTFWNPLIYYSMNAKVRKYLKENIHNTLFRWDRSVSHWLPPSQSSGPKAKIFGEAHFTILRDCRYEILWKRESSLTWSLNQKKYDFENIF